ncbi:hypothetical protein GCM10010485_28280 [Streptosporangium carneum]
MIPPAATAATTACEVQLAGVPVPTTRVERVVSTARAAAGTATRPSRFPGAASRRDVRAEAVPSRAPLSSAALHCPAEDRPAPQAGAAEPDTLARPIINEVRAATPHLARTPQMLLRQLWRHIGIWGTRHGAKGADTRGECPLLHRRSACGTELSSPPEHSVPEPPQEYELAREEPR